MLLIGASRRIDEVDAGRLCDIGELRSSTLDGQGGAKQQKD
jgi:hypothetical protein